MAAILMGWTELKRTRRWTPLSQVSPQALRVSTGVYRHDPNAYLICMPYGADLVERPGGPFVTALLWAADDGAAMRSQAMDIEEDYRADVVPPDEMLLAPGLRTYRAIMREVRSGRHGEFKEWADYRTAMDGRFVQRTVSVGAYHFHFRSPEEVDEPCFAVRFRLSV